MFIPHSEDLTEQPRKRAMSTPTIIKRQKQKGCKGRYKNMVQVRVHNDGWNILTAIDPYSSNTLKINILLDFLMKEEIEKGRNGEYGYEILNKIFNLYEKYEEEHDDMTKNTKFTKIAVNVDNIILTNIDGIIDGLEDITYGLQRNISRITYALTNLLECGFIIEILKKGLSK